MNTALQGKFALLSVPFICLFIFSGCHRKTMEETAPAYKFSAQELFKEFNAEEAADKKYVGQILEVSGVVDKTGTDVADRPFVDLESGSALGAVQCFFGDKYKDEAAKLVKGRKVTFRGKTLSKIMHVTLDECIIIAK